MYDIRIQFTKVLVAKASCATDCSLLRTLPLERQYQGSVCVCARVCGGSEGSSEECVVRVVTAKGAAWGVVRCLEASLHPRPRPLQYHSCTTMELHNNSPIDGGGSGMESPRNMVTGKGMNWREQRKVSRNATYTYMYGPTTYIIKWWLVQKFGFYFCGWSLLAVPSVLPRVKKGALESSGHGKIETSKHQYWCVAVHCLSCRQPFCGIAHTTTSVVPFKEGKVTGL